MIMKICSLVLAIFLIIGCSSDPDYYRAADNKVLCELKTNKAFLVKPRIGDNSTVERSQHYDDMCKTRI